MRKNPLNALEVERKIRETELVKHLLEDDLGGARKRLEWISIAQKVSSDRTHRRNNLTALIIAAFCTIAVGLAMSLKMPYANVSIELVTREATFVNSETWRSREPFVADEVFLGNLQSVSDWKFNGSSKEVRYGQVMQPFDTTLVGSGIELKEFEVKTKAIIELETSANQLSMYVQRANVTGYLSVREDIVALGGTSRKETSVPDFPPKYIYFKTIDPVLDAEPVHIDMKNNVSWKFDNMKIDSLGTRIENPLGSGNFQSAVISGSFSIHETNFRGNIAKYDDVLLEIADNLRLSVENDGPYLRILFEGRVSKIMVGPQGFVKDYKPSLLDYIYHNQRITFLWSTIVFMWGMIWSVRKTFSRNAV